MALIELGGNAFRCSMLTCGTFLCGFWLEALHGKTNGVREKGPASVIRAGRGLLALGWTVAKRRPCHFWAAGAIVEAEHTGPQAMQKIPVGRSAVRAMVTLLPKTAVPLGVRSG